MKQERERCKFYVGCGECGFDEQAYTPCYLGSHFKQCNLYEEKKRCVGYPADMDMTQDEILKSPSTMRVSIGTNESRYSEYLSIIGTTSRRMTRRNVSDSMFVRPILWKSRMRTIIRKSVNVKIRNYEQNLPRN